MTPPILGDDLFPKYPDGSVKYDYTSYIETWEALEKVVDEGLVRHIGLSNFNSKQVDEVSRDSRMVEWIVDGWMNE